MMELLIVVAIGALGFMALVRFSRRQGQKATQRLQQEITPGLARQAVLLLDDAQHKAVYRAIAAGQGRDALAAFREATGATLRESVIAVQALYQYPQPAPSQIQFERDFNLNNDDEPVEDEYLEDTIDQVRDDTEGAGLAEEGPLAEADPNTGEILGENQQNVPNIPGGQAGEVDDDEVDARARELMRESGFDPDEELTIPDEWAQDEDEQAGFHLEVQRGDEKVTLSHEDLEPWVHDQLYALLRDDKVDEASLLLADHSPLTQEEAHRFLVVFKDQS